MVRVGRRRAGVGRRRDHTLDVVSYAVITGKLRFDFVGLAYLCAGCCTAA